MSSRQTGARYGMYGYQPQDPTGGGRGGTSLLDVLTGNTPSKLIAQKHGYEKEMEDLIFQHDKDFQAIAGKMSKDKDFRENAIKQAPPGSFDKEGNTTPAGEEYYKNLALQQVKNIAQQASMSMEAMKAPGAQEATNKRFLAEQAQPDVENRAKLTAKAGPEETVFTPGGNTGLDTTTRGALRQQTSTMGGGFPMKQADGSYIMVGQQPIITAKDTAGGVTKGNTQISPDDLTAALGGSRGLFDTGKQNPVGDTGGFNPTLSYDKMGFSPTSNAQQSAVQQVPSSIPKQDPTGGGNQFDPQTNTILSTLLKALFSGQAGQTNSPFTNTSFGGY